MDDSKTVPELACFIFLAVGFWFSTHNSALFSTDARTATVNGVEPFSLFVEDVVVQTTRLKENHQKRVPSPAN